MSKLACILLFLIFNIVSCRSYEKVRTLKYEEALTHKPYDLLVVPGAPYDPKSEWSDMLKARVLWSVFLYKNGFAKKVMYSGAAVYTPYVEARIMRLMAIELGIKEEHIVLDTLAEHSSENVYFAHLYRSKNGLNSMAIATDAYQALRFKQFSQFSNIPFDVIPWIADSLNLSTKEPKIDYTQAFKTSFIPIQNRKTFFERFRNSGGRHLPDSIREKTTFKP